MQNDASSSGLQARERRFAQSQPSGESLAADVASVDSLAKVLRTTGQRASCPSSFLLLPLLLPLMAKRASKSNPVAAELEGFKKSKQTKISLGDGASLKRALDDAASAVCRGTRLFSATKLRKR